MVCIHNILESIKRKKDSLLLFQIIEDLLSLMYKDDLLFKLLLSKLINIMFLMFLLHK